MSDCEVGRIVAEIKELRKDIAEVNHRLGSGDVNFATLQLRMNLVEKVVYGAVGVGLSSLALGIVGLVTRH